MVAAAAAAAAIAIVIAGFTRRRVAGPRADGMWATRTSLIRCCLIVRRRPSGSSRSAGAGSSRASSATSPRRASSVFIGTPPGSVDRVLALIHYLFTATRGFPVPGHQLPEPAAGPGQPGPYRADRHTQDRGGRGVVKLRPDAQRDDLALAAAQRSQRFRDQPQPSRVIEAPGQVSAKSGTAGGGGSLLRAAWWRRDARARLRQTLTAMPSSQGCSDSPLGSILALRRHASRNVSETTSSAADQFAVSRKPRLYTARAYSSKIKPNASGSPARMRARRFGSTYFPVRSPPRGSRPVRHLA